MKQVALTKENKRLLKLALKRDSKVVFQEIENQQAMLVLTEQSNMLAVLRIESRTLVVVAAVGSDLFGTRDEFIELARAENCTAIRFHTKYPERLRKGLRGLDIQLVEVRKNPFGSDERVYKYQVL